MANISVEEARRLCVSALNKTGMAEHEAKIIADLLIEAEMRSRPTHGLIRLPGIVSGVAKQADAKMQIVREDTSYALVDGGGKFGYIAAHYAMELAIKKAAENGLSMVGVKNSGHSGMVGYYARMALEHDLSG